MLKNIFMACSDITERIPDVRLEPAPFDSILHAGATNLSLVKLHESLDYDTLEQTILPYLLNVVSDNMRRRSIYAAEALQQQLWECELINPSIQLV